MALLFRIALLFDRSKLQAILGTQEPASLERRVEETQAFAVQIYSGLLPEQRRKSVLAQAASSNRYPV